MAAGWQVLTPDAPSASTEGFALVPVALIADLLNASSLVQVELVLIHPFRPELQDKLRVNKHKRSLIA
ncbi:MAG: hypothetical protein FJ077_14585 [Cyanobacteria bacterium K_DeepCast_35m_m2_023]|nr:hypothetical protein [Cyanobacteria bacterium K_DeepCast_35m_m2_023]